MDDFNTVARVAATGCLVPHPIPPPTARASLLRVGIKDSPSHVRPRGIVEGQILEEVELLSGSGPSRGVRVWRVLGRCRVECERCSSALLLIGMGPRRRRWRRGPGGIEGGGGRRRRFGVLEEVLRRGASQSPQSVGAALELRQPRGRNDVRQAQ
jgi:hypothetical protein